MDTQSETTAQKIMKLEWSAIIVVSLVFLAVGFLISQPLPLVVVGFVGTFVLTRRVRSLASVGELHNISTKSASTHDYARIFNVVDGLCAVSGDARPRIEVADVHYPLAAAIGEPGDAAIVISHDLYTLLDRVETEAVMAHLLWRIRTGDTSLTSYLMSLSVVLSRIGLGSLARLVASRLVNPQSLIWADIAACQATRYPPALISALEKIDGTHGNAPDSTSSPLWFAVSDASASATTTSSIFSIVEGSRPSIAYRIGVLKEI